jgi:hypothetical protein
MKIPVIGGDHLAALGTSIWFISVVGRVEQLINGLLSWEEIPSPFNERIAIKQGAKLTKRTSIRILKLDILECTF